MPLGSWSPAEIAGLLVLAALVLAALDLVLQVTILLHVSIALFATAITVWYPGGPIAKAIVFPASWSLGIVGYYLFYRSHLEPWLHQVIAPERFRHVPQAMVGQIGEICDIEGVRMIRIAGDLWRCHPESSVLRETEPPHRGIVIELVDGMPVVDTATRG